MGAKLSVARVFYYDAVDTRDPVEAAQQEAHLDRLQSLPHTFVATGETRWRKKRGLEQKAVDVKLAVDALEAAYAGHIAAVALIAGDLDFAPLVEAIRRAGPHVLVGALEATLAPELRAAADEVHYLDVFFEPATAAKWMMLPPASE